MKHLAIICILTLLICCDKKKESQPEHSAFDTYLNSLATLPTPQHFGTNLRLANLSLAYDSALFLKYKNAWADRPYGKVVYNDSTIVVIEVAIGEFVVPLLTTFDREGNKVDSLDLFEQVGWDIGFHADEFITLTADKKIIITDSITRWDLNETQDDIIEGTEKLTVKTFVYTIDGQGSIKLTAAPPLDANEVATDSVFMDSASATNENLIHIDFPLDSLLQFDSETALKNIFGENIERSTGYYPEGMGQYPNTLLFSGTKNEVEFVWKDDSITFSGLAYIEVNHEGSDWKTREGITIGTTLKELEKLNRKAFSFFGFAWDYSGATDWENGELAARKIFVSLQLPGEGFPPEFEGLLGDRSFPSDSSLSQKANPFVRQIVMRR